MNGDRIRKWNILDAIGAKNQHIPDVLFINLRRPGVVRIGCIAVTDLVATDLLFRLAADRSAIPRGELIIVGFPQYLADTILEPPLTRALNKDLIGRTQDPIPFFIG